MKNLASILLKPISAITSSIILSSCIATGMNPDYSGPKPLSEEVRSEFSQEKFNGEYKESIIRVEDNYVLKQIKLNHFHNGSGLTHPIIIDHYDLKGKDNNPALMVLPILGGSNKIAKKFAEYLSDNGYSSLIVHRQKKYRNSLREFKDLNKTLKETVLDHQQVLDWMETQKDIDMDRIGVLGVSMGAIKGMLLFCYDPRIKAGVFAMGGGDLPYILTHSDEKKIKKYRKRFMEENNMNIREFYTMLQQNINIDPINCAPHIDASKTLMFLAAFDDTVPIEKGEELWRAIGEPEKITVPFGHYSAMLTIFPFPYVQGKSLEFFDKRFKK